MKLFDSTYMDRFVNRAPYLKIYDKDARLSPFVPNFAQRMLLATIASEVEEGRPPRILVLKARQQGISTGTQGLFFDTALNWSGMKSLTVAHESKATHEIFNKSLTYLKNIPGFKRIAKTSGKNEIPFMNGSLMYNRTAGGHEVGSGSTHNMFHWSEVAKSERVMNKAEKNFISVMQSVPKRLNSLVVLESTAQGRGGLFFNLCEAAQKGKSKFRLLFIPWHWHWEYRLPLKAGEKFDLTSEEEDLRSAYNLSLEQIKWRRDMIENECMGDEDYFKQEYPISYAEAWLASGRFYFERRPLMAQERRAKGQRPPITGEFELPKNPLVKPIWRMAENSNGRLKIWEWPEPDEQYAIGVDVAQGLEHGDNSVVEVFRCRDNTQVAEWAGKARGDVLAQIVWNLALKYNDPYVGVEVNQDMTCAVNLQSWGYWNVHHRDVVDVDHYGTEGKPQTRIGWWTDKRTKRLALDHFHTLLRCNEITLNSQELIGECQDFLMDEKGAGQAPEGKHDDRVMATAIALQMVRQHYQPAEQEQPKSEAERIIEAYEEDMRKYRSRQRKSQRIHQSFR